jgi:benzoyl-CoA reductase/2-hydroxyglutaryl-CoA dehydratase subunit BcrC/BadD/HgdB
MLLEVVEEVETVEDWLVEKAVAIESKALKFAVEVVEDWLVAKTFAELRKATFVVAVALRFEIVKIEVFVAEFEVEAVIESKLEIVED